MNNFNKCDNLTLFSQLYVFKHVFLLAYIIATPYLCYINLKQINNSALDITVKSEKYEKIKLLSCKRQFLSAMY